MDPGQQSSSSSSRTTPFSNEETRLFYSIRGSMDETFRFANALGKVGLWEEISRRFRALGHRRSPQELEAMFGHYKPKRPRKKRKRAAQAEHAGAGSGAPQPGDRPEQPEDRLARSRGVEAARKKLLEEIDLTAFFCEENSWKSAVIAVKLGGIFNFLPSYRMATLQIASLRMTIHFYHLSAQNDTILSYFTMWHSKSACQRGR